jgi:hypothetical protein
VRLVQALDRYHRVRAVPFQKRGVPEGAGLTLAECAQSAWAITPSGKRFAGAAAVNLALAVALGTPIPHDVRLTLAVVFVKPKMDKVIILKRLLNRVQ